MAPLTRIFEPFAIGPVSLRNRVVFPGHTTNFAVGNLPTDRHVAYHAARAKGGVGLIISEAIRIHPTSAGRPATIAGYTDAMIPGLAKIVDAVHGHGAKFFAQLAHLGREAAVEHQLAASWGASPIPWGTGQHMPHVMTTRDIASAVEHFGAAAARVVKAGCDGIELHFGHGHLINQFLSPATNKRSDSYGGTLANRMRFGCEVLDATLKNVGKVPVGIRVSAHEFLDDGLDPDQVEEVIGELKSRYPLAFVNVSHAAYVHAYSLSTQIADSTHPSVPFKAFPAQFKRAFSDLPMIAVCRVDDLATAETLLAEDVADLVGLARPHIADPDLVAKAQGGRDGAVRTCIACNIGCIGRIEQGSAITCVANPEAGFEQAWTSLRSRSSSANKSVAVVGGGPAGLEAAMAAARRGHRVTLYEKDDVLGGAFRIAAQLPGRARFQRLIDDLARDATAAGAEIKLGSAFSSDMTADAVIVATGAKDVVRPVQGITTLGPREAIASPQKLGDTVAIIDERGTWHAYGIAEMLAQRGARVHLITPVAGFAWKVTIYIRLGLIQRLSDLGVHSHLHRRVVGLRTNGLVMADVIGGGEQTLSRITGVVDVGPAAADDALVAGVHKRIGEVHVIGDAYAPRGVLEAVYEGRVVGTTLADSKAELPAIPGVGVYF